MLESFIKLNKKCQSTIIDVENLSFYRSLISSQNSFNDMLLKMGIEHSTVLREKVNNELIDYIQGSLYRSLEELQQLSSLSPEANFLHTDACIKNLDLSPHIAIPFYENVKLFI